MLNEKTAVFRKKLNPLGVIRSATASVIIRIEKAVINPKPRPILPNTCCSMGASLIEITNNIWIIIKDTNRSKNRSVLFPYIRLYSFKIFGNKYKASEKSSIIFGTTIESLFTHGVKARKIKLENIMIILKVLFCSILFTRII